MSKILHISQRYAPAFGGAEKYVQTVAEWNVRQGHSVDVWTTDALDADALWFPQRKKVDVLEEDINGVHVIRFKTSPSIFNNVFVTKGFRYVLSHLPNWFIQYFVGPPMVFGMYRKLLDKTLPKYDIIHVSAMPYTSIMYVGMKLAKRMSAKFYITPFQHVGVKGKYVAEDKYYHPRTIPFFYNADTIFIQTEAERSDLTKFFKQYPGIKDPSDGVYVGYGLIDNTPISKETPLILQILAKLFIFLVRIPIAVISFFKRIFGKKRGGEIVDVNKMVKVGLGVWPEEFVKGGGDDFRKRYNISSNTPIVFYVGARAFVKGTKGLVEAMEKVWKKGVDAKLVLAGGTTMEFEQLWEKVSDVVKKNSIVLDRVSDEERYNIFDAGDLFVMVSTSESFGIVYLESWLYKKPVIGCKIGSVMEVINSGVDGYTVEFDDSEEISKRIVELLKDSKKRKQFGESGYKKVMANYTWEEKFKILEKYFNI